MAKAAKMKADARKRAGRRPVRRLTREQKDWLLLKEHLHPAFVEHLLKVTAVIKHAKLLGYTVGVLRTLSQDSWLCFTLDWKSSGQPSEPGRLKLLEAIRDIRQGYSESGVRQ